MRIGIIGAGRIGGTAARLLVAAGHEVGLSNSRGPLSLRDDVERLGPRACAMTIEECARFGDAVLLAIPWGSLDSLPSARAVAGKVVIDAMNPFGAGGRPIDLGPIGSSEEVARRLPGARLVKAFNTMQFKILASQGRPDKPLVDRLCLFVAGDDSGAKRLVEDLIIQVGFAPVDTGTLREGGARQQPGSPLFAAELTPAQARSLLQASMRPASPAP
jgi:predicted dinucleotide-binding enzyme